MNQAGEFIVVFTTEIEGPGHDVYLRFRRYNADGTPKGNAYPLAEDTEGFNDPSISMNNTGNYVAVWSWEVNRVYAQLFDSNDDAVGDVLEIPTSGSTRCGLSQVSIDENGRFVVVWYELRGTYEVFGRCYDSGGIPDSKKFQLSDYTTADQLYPVVLIQPSGRFVTAWESDGQDGSEEGIFTRFWPETFAGDFTGDGKLDSGDLDIFTSRWLQDEPVLDIAPRYSPDGIANFLDYAALAEFWLWGQ
jgi:hypothetical protein